MPSLSKEKWVEIIRRYQCGELAGNLAKEFGCSGAAVSSMLSRRGIIKHDASYVYRTAAGKMLDESAFDSITPESAYWIGFLMADGGLSDGNTVGLVLAEKDEAHLRKFRSFVGSNNKIISGIANRFSDDYKVTLASRFAFRSARICDAIAKHGVTKRKSANAKTSSELALNKDFWRGVVDGDGYLALVHKKSYFNRHPKINAWSKPRESARLDLVGSATLLDQFRNFVLTIVPNAKITVRPHKSIYRVGLGDNTAKAVISELYSGASVYLDRKYNASINALLSGMECAANRELRYVA